MARIVRRKALAAITAVHIAARAQNGDHAGEIQREVVPSDRIPPAPALTPEQEIATFQVAPGFHVDLMAAEPLVSSPVAMQFDERGRVWVVEMKGFMPNADGRGEDRPVGDIAILEDTDGDGRMDKRTVFLDHLVMPRAAMLFLNGALVAEPPNVWFAADVDGDGRADSKTLLFKDYASPDDPKYGARANPEHASNGIFWSLDNWAYSANHTFRYRWRGGPATNWISGPTIFRGQWGISQDDTGRLYHNSNSDQLRADLVPAEYLLRNPNLRPAYGANVPLTADQRVWPARVNPGVNRGYQPGQLNPNGRLATYTATCAPVVYRGDQFGPETVGDVFLCEPAGNLIRRDHILDLDGELTATNAYDHAEFLASTDERFRPVNLANGPDGALYVVDIYRGIIQHRIYLTSYLRKQAESRGLQDALGQGRLWRVTRNGHPIRRDVLPAKPTLESLIAWLSDSNGWRRDRAQQLLIERQNPSDAGALESLVRNEPPTPPLGRLHALWTLEGLDQLDFRTVEAALLDPDTRVRTAALRLSERFFEGEEGDAAKEAILRHASGAVPGERLQLLLTLGQIHSPEADRRLRALLLAGPTRRLDIDAAVSGLGGRELESLTEIAAHVPPGAKGADLGPLWSSLSRCVINEGRPERAAELLDLAAAQEAGGWRQLAILDGIASVVPTPRGNQAPPPFDKVRLAAEPKSLATLQAIAQPEVSKRVGRVAQAFRWPGKTGEIAEPEIQPLTGESLASFSRGKELYSTICGACHQPHGNGQEGLAPPLRRSEWVLGDEQRLGRIALRGVRDELTVRGSKYTLNMPGLGDFLNDQQLADVLTYVRREWGHGASPVAAATIRSIRLATAGHEDSWTEPELLRIH